VAAKGSARRYARAIFELSEKKRIDDWQVDLEKIINISKDETIAAYLENPSFRFEDKAKLLQGKLGDINQMVLNVVYVLIKRSRLDMLQDIVTEYQYLVDNYKGIERVEVTTAVPLDDKAREKLNLEIGRLIGKQIVLETEYVDPELIGGVVVKVAGKLLDGSTKGKLAALKREIS
jgi:F-type H+-transporting ATPase subunit delta